MQSVCRRGVSSVFRLLALMVACGSWAADAGRALGSDTAKHALLLPGSHTLQLGMMLPHQPALPPDSLHLVAVKADPADRIYFQRCAGCHGGMREGGTGKPLTLAITRKHGFAYLRNIIHNGTPNGMPDWGVSGELAAHEVETMARYLLKAPVAPPKLTSLSEIRASWKTHIPNTRRPFRQMSSLDLDGQISVRINDDGRLALVKEAGDETVLGIKSAQAVVRAQLSVSNRYLYTMDCDARITLFDLWMKEPAPVAEITTGVEGRSMAPSAIQGTEQLSLLVGVNWPPQYVVLDGRTLEPHILHKFQDFGDVRVGCITE